MIAASPLLQIAIGLAVTVVLGFGVKPLLAFAKREMSLPPPSASLQGQWDNLTKGNEGGAILGWLERLLFFAAFWAEAHIVIGAWLAFKVASKWNAWSNVISVPNTIEGLDPIDFLIARRTWGSHLLMTFLIGSAYNIIAGLVGAVVGRNWGEVLRSVCS